MKAEELGRVHFMGIGGAGMSGIARIMAMRGIPVTGCDAKESRALVGLRALGVTATVGHDPAHLENVDTVVYSSAIRSHNPELKRAADVGLRILQRAEALATLMVDRRVIAIGGTHGKTTTTSMLSVVLQHAGLDPSFAIGGTITDSGAHAHDGSGDFFVVEADESDGSFVHYRPEIAVVTNVEADHMDHFQDEASVSRAFEDFAQTVSGSVIVCGDDERAASLLKNHQGLSYGTSSCDLTIREISSAQQVSFSAAWKGQDLGRFQLSIPGHHNALNAGAVITAAIQLEVNVDAVKSGLTAFTGTRRRFERRGESPSVVVIDDYAHHPTEIAATLQATRDAYPGRRIIAVFQPHRYSRTAAFLPDFAQALSAADLSVITEVYSAGEETIPGATGSALAHEVERLDAPVIYEPSLTHISERVVEALTHDPTVVLTLGAGDITLIAGEIADRVCAAG